MIEVQGICSIESAAPLTANRPVIPHLRKRCEPMVTTDQIVELSERIAEAFHPQRIVLFGSHAWGTPTPDSDVDLLVVMPFEGKPAGKSVEIRLKVRPSFPVDLIVRTPEAIRERLAMGDTFIRDILEHGVLLYEADHR